MNTKQNLLQTNVDNINIGYLIKENGKFIFSYKKDAISFISLTMPVRVKQYLNNQLHPIFEMHLPEGYLLSVIKKHFSKLAKTDDFGLLQLMSKSIKGRISYGDTSIKENKSLSLKDLLYPSDNNLFEELVVKFAFTSSLSGVQPKVMAKVIDKATLKYNDYIVKSWGDDYPQLALNEYYCMRIVELANIEVPKYYISSDDKLFVMKRFDIKDDDTKIGFEDMCVLQAKQRDDKYEGTYEQVAKTIKTFVSSKNKKTSLKQFFKMIIINNIIQNGDAHLKNFGLVYDDLSNIKLAPAYDVVSTTVYIKNDIPALHLLGAKKWWDKEYLLKFGIENCELSKNDVTKLYEECLVSTNKVKDEITIRIKDETNIDKLKVLNHLFVLLENKKVANEKL